MYDRNDATSERLVTTVYLHLSADCRFMMGRIHFPERLAATAPLLLWFYAQPQTTCSSSSVQIGLVEDEVSMSVIRQVSPRLL
jgi:hypothetical protein